MPAIWAFRGCTLCSVLMCQMSTLWEHSCQVPEQTVAKLAVPLNKWPIKRHLLLTYESVIQMQGSFRSAWNEDAFWKFWAQEQRGEKRLRSLVL